MSTTFNPAHDENAALRNLQGKMQASKIAAPRRILRDVSNVQSTHDAKMTGPVKVGLRVPSTTAVKPTTVTSEEAPVQIAAQQKQPEANMWQHMNHIKITACDTESDSSQIDITHEFDAEADPMPISPCTPRSITTFSRVPFMSPTGVDKADKMLPQQVADIACDIVRVWRQEEVKRSVASTYMSIQEDINERMRAVLLDWLIEVHLKFKLAPETLYLATNLIDRFLALKRVGRSRLQLVGVTAMFVACKYQEIYPPEAKDFVFISDNAYSLEEVLRMEELLLNTLQFRLVVPSALAFAQRLTRVAEQHDNKEFECLVHYALEWSLVDYKMLEFLPSVTATAAVSLACDVFGCDRGHGAEDAIGRVDAVQVAACRREMIGLLRGAKFERLSAVPRKFALPKFSRVAESVKERLAQLDA